MNRLLIIGSVWPEPKSSAAGSRMMQLIHLFLNEKYKITFATSCSKSENAFDLESLGIKEQEIKLNDSSFNDFVKNLNPNIVLFDRFMIEEQYGWRVTEQCPDALRILDTEDLHCLRKGRHQALKYAKPFDKSYLFNETATREIASIYRCDLSLIISEVEMDILKNEFKIDESLIYYLPFLQDSIDELGKIKLPKFSDRNHFMTIGNFLHQPNSDSINYLKHSIWPLIRKQLPQAEMHIYGAYASQKTMQMHDEKSGFLIKGFADNVNDVMQKAKVCLAPLRFGAGLKGKLIDAMINGTPIVTTDVGAEGLYGKLEPNGFIENNPQDYAEYAVRLFVNETLWNEKQPNGFEIINTRFNANNFEVQFINKVNDLQKTLSQHRLNNFTGQLLQHHTMQSTKYMSKWIEEKNKG